MEPWVVILIALACLVAGGLVVFFVPFFKIKKSNAEAKKIIKDAEQRGEKIIKNAQVDGKQTAFELKQNAEKEIKERKREIDQMENRINQREQNIDRRDALLTQKEDALDEKNRQAAKKLKDLDVKEELLQAKIDSIITELEKVSGLSTKEAHDEIMARVESKMSSEIAQYIKNEEDKAKDEVETKAKELLGLALAKYAQDVTSERTVSVVALPSDEMKGRIIGREGRNIKTIENMLGVDLIIDDTPEVITVSCFDPVRREIARRSLEYLIRDGRIQPGRIEEVVEKTTKEVNDSVAKAGEEAAFKLGLPRINRELLNYVGRLKYRTSYGQNCYDHSIEVATLAGVMAAELGLDQNMAKRAGLLHDVGKASDSEMDGNHVEVGVRLAKKYGEPDIVINAIESHHGDVEAKYVISNLVMAADALSAARPGARSEILENYIKRIEQLETICKSYEGVQQAFAMQSGREVRVMVTPEKMSDVEAFKLAHDIKERIENEMTYPGQIKVSVIREFRANEIAK